ncbi:MAG: hypothetical protein HKN76_12055 [Saprospiraceae bacterium]|nr:hypothetical protein [Saprospiraceae bacterium]
MKLISMDFEFKGTIYAGEKIRDHDTYSLLPADLQSLMQDLNGIIAYQGGLHIRGCVNDPDWHSIHYVWKGEFALHKIFSNLRPSDVPFAQDCLGDQYILRVGTVWHLMAETGELEDLELELFDFLEEVITDPVDFLSLEPLLVYLEEGNTLEPGFLLRPNPPFAIEAENYKLEKVRIEERLKDF